jgi:Kef-type K+ transport system membrane component KefB
MTTGVIFFWIAFILILTRISTLIERIGQPAVMGELFVGIVLGNLSLAGLNFIEPVKHDLVFKFLSELGVVILLFEVGLESKIEEMRRLGFRVFLVACVGVVLPFLLAYSIVAPVFMPAMKFETRLFLGAMLTATSVGITARVFQDLGKLKSEEARIVLGAAVIDDILGLSILAVIKAIVESGNINLQGVAWITFKAVAFLGAAIFLGQILTQWLGKTFSRIHPGVGMKFILAISFCLMFACLADFMGLAPIVGAFAAGLILEPVHFIHFDDPDIIRDIEAAISNSHQKAKRKVIQLLETHADIHVQTLIKPLAYFLVPLFFVRTGMEVKIEVFIQPGILLLALGITVAAFVGKILAGMLAGPVQKSVVGWGLVPRGEVTLIFATTGKALGVLSDSLFSAIIIMVIISTVVVPPVLNFLLKAQKS